MTFRWATRYSGLARDPLSNMPATIILALGSAAKCEEGSMWFGCCRPPFSPRLRLIRRRCWCCCYSVRRSPRPSEILLLICALNPWSPATVSGIDAHHGGGRRQTLMDAVRCPSARSEELNGGRSSSLMRLVSIENKSLLSSPPPPTRRSHHAQAGAWDHCAQAGHGIFSMRNTSRRGSGR
jgi:hypothetical protein